ncbi:MAG: MFS transporter [Planctomycetaceae bacterium]
MVVRSRRDHCCRLVLLAGPRSRPQHPRVNAAELRVIGSPPDAPAMAERVPWLPILRSPSLWLISIASFGTNVGWVFLVSLLDRYLYSVHRVPYVERGFMQSLPLFIGWIGMLLGGWWTDRLTRRGVRIGRACRSPSAGSSRWRHFC